MRSAAGDKAVVAALIGLVLLALALRGGTRAAAEGMPADRIAGAIAHRLAADGFAVDVRTLPLGSMVVDARRGTCTVRARDATYVLGQEVAIADEARAVGPVAYLYGGRAFPAPPALRIRLGRLGRELLRPFGAERPVGIAVALARTAGCGNDRFGLDRLALARG